MWNASSPSTLLGNGRLKKPISWKVAAVLFRYVIHSVKTDVCRISCLSFAPT